MIADHLRCLRRTSKYKPGLRSAGERRLSGASGKGSAVGPASKLIQDASGCRGDCRLRLRPLTLRGGVSERRLPGGPPAIAFRAICDMENLIGAPPELPQSPKNAWRWRWARNWGLLPSEVIIFSPVGLDEVLPVQQWQTPKAARLCNHGDSWERFQPPPDLVI